MPMSAAAIAGRIVHAVAGHRDDVALALQHLDQPDLVLRSHPRDHADPVDGGVRFRVAHRRELGARHRAALDAEFSGDRGGRDRVVSGDHPHPDARTVRLGDRGHRLGPRRVDLADQRRQLEVLHQRHQVAGRVEGRRIELPLREREHATALTGDALVLGQHFRARLLGERIAALRGHPHRRRKAQEHIRSTLHVRADHRRVAGPGHPMEGRHELVVGVERNGCDARVRLSELPHIHPALLREHVERALGRIADDLAVPDVGVVAQRAREHHVVQIAFGVSVGELHLAVETVALAGDRVVVLHGRDLAHGHLVERQRSGLVGVDRRRRPERLDRGQHLHDGVLLRHVDRPDRQDGRDDGRERIRNRAHGERHADPEQHLERLALHEAHHDDGDEREQRRDDDEDREAVDLFGERGLLHFLLGQQAGDVADLRPHPRGRDEDLAVTAGHIRVHERHVEAVADPDVRAVDGHRILLDGDALAGQRSFLDLQGRGEDDPPVGGDPVARVDDHDVARHDLIGDELDDLSAATHLRRRLHHLAQRRRGRLGLALLVVAEPRVEQGQQEEADGGLVLVDDQADAGRDDEHDLHVVAVVLEEPSPGRLGLRGRERVRPVLLEPLRGLGRAQTLRRVHLQPGRDLLGAERVPRGRRCGLLR